MTKKSNELVSIITPIYKCEKFVKDTLTAMGIVMIHLPVDVLFLSGGGLTVDQLIFRILYRVRHRELYTKCGISEEDCL